MQSPTSLCYDCNYFRALNSRTCDAFPEGIPDEVWIGTVKHDKPYPGDHGIQFKPKFPNEFLSVTKVANLFSVNPKTIYRALWSERLPAYKIGKAWRIARKDLERFKKKQLKLVFFYGNCPGQSNKIGAQWLELPKRAFLKSS